MPSVSYSLLNYLKEPLPLNLSKTELFVAFKRSIFQRPINDHCSPLDVLRRDSSEKARVIGKISIIPYKKVLVLTDFYRTEIVSFAQPPIYVLSIWEDSESIIVTYIVLLVKTPIIDKHGFISYGNRLTGKPHTSLNKALSRICRRAENNNIASA